MWGCEDRELPRELRTAHELPWSETVCVFVGACPHRHEAGPTVP